MTEDVKPKVEAGKARRTWGKNTRHSNNFSSNSPRDFKFKAPTPGHKDLIFKYTPGTNVNFSAL